MKVQPEAVDGPAVPFGRSRSLSKREDLTENESSEARVSAKAESRPTAKVSREIEREAYKAGEFIFFEGDIDFHMYIIEMGEVQIFTKKKNGERVDIARLEEGESFGEFALLDKKPRSASAEALTACVVYRVSETGFEQLLEELPTWASSMLRNFSVRMRNMNELVKNLPQFVDKKEY